MITTADFMKCGFLCTSGMEAVELVVDAGLLVTVSIEDALALSSGGSAALTFVVSTVTGVFGIGDFV